MFINKDKEIIPLGSYEWEGVKHPPSIFRLWSEEDLSQIGIYKVHYPEIPEGMEVVDWGYSINEHNATAIPELVPSKPYVPFSVSKAQGKAALVLQGIMGDVLTYLDGLEEPEKSLALIAFDDTNEWQRDSEMLSKVANHLNLSEEDLDDLFILAETIKL